MQKINRDAISGLLTSEVSPAITIYIPIETSAAPPHITENQIRFKNLIHKADAELKTWTGNTDTSRISEQLRAFLDANYSDMDFWKTQTRGLLICAGGEQIQTFNLPVDTEEYVSIDDSYHLAPVLALLGDARDYYVLALAQQNPRLYRGDMYDVTEMTDVLPVSLEKTLGIDEMNIETESQGSASGSSLNTGGYNGRGGSHDLQNADRVKFFHLIDKQLLEHVDRSAPLILAGTEDEIAEYRGLSKHPVVLRGVITGNHTETPAGQIFAKAISIINSELIAPDHLAVREEYERISGANPERVAHTNDSILAAAEQGRVDKLLAMMSRHTTDTVQDKFESVVRITFPDAGHSKTLNNLATKVWRMSGKVFSLMPHEMPNGAPMVARLRY